MIAIVTSLNLVVRVIRLIFLCLLENSFSSFAQVSIKQGHCIASLRNRKDAIRLVPLKTKFAVQIK